LRWWTPEEIENTGEDVYPRDLAEVLRRMRGCFLAGERKGTSAPDRSLFYEAFAGEFHDSIHLTWRVDTSGSVVWRLGRARG
jgi:hypothetical protein